MPKAGSNPVFFGLTSFENRIAVSSMKLPLPASPAVDTTATAQQRPILSLLADEFHGAGALASADDCVRNRAAGALREGIGAKIDPTRSAAREIDRFICIGAACPYPDICRGIRIGVHCLPDIEIVIASLVEARREGRAGAGRTGIPRWNKAKAR